MSVSLVSTKLTARTFRHPLKKYIWLMFLLLTAVAYINPTFAQAASNTQSNQNDKKEMITGAFGIKFGDDIQPYLEGHYSDSSMSVPGLENLPAKTFKYLKLNPPINLQELFPDASIELLGIRDDNNRVIVLRLSGFGRGGLACEQIASINGIRELLRQKYKITKPQPKYEPRDWIEEYGDSEGNNIRLHCSGGIGGFDVKFTSHLFSDYIARLKAEKQKQQDGIKGNLLKHGGF